MLYMGLDKGSRKGTKHNSLRNTGSRKSKGKTKKVANLRLDQQVICFAEIIVNQLLKELNVYENK